MDQPTRLGTFVFAVKASILRWRRRVRDFVKGRPPKARRGQLFAESAVAASVVSPLWTQMSADEFRLTAGKVHNLRLAARAVDGLEYGPGEVFSFWRVVGRPSRHRGFVDGREIRMGCLVPSIAGGLCQLSNALYDVALNAGLTITERHAHTRRIPGSLTMPDRDATVFWNYVDLRFFSPTGMRVETELTAGELLVRIRVPQAGQSGGRGAVGPGPGAVGGAASCETCGVHSCFRHQELHRDGRGRIQAGAAALLDGVIPEFLPYLELAKAQAKELGMPFAIHLPLNGMARRLPQYAWPTAGASNVHEARWATMARSFRSRRLKDLGAARQRAQRVGDAALARHFARQLKPEIVHLIVAQNLLAPLEQLGVLGGRTVEVLAFRLPLPQLQAALDQALKKNPDSPTLGDYRAPKEIVAAEAKALSRARAVISAHALVIELFSKRAQRLAWHLPAVAGPARGRVSSSPPSILFPGPTVGRRGAHLVRAAARALGLVVLRTGQDLEGPDFWSGVVTERIGSSANDLDAAFARARAVVSPVVIESAPRVVLRALAHQVPVVVTRASGLGDTEIARGAVVLNDDTEDGLIAALELLTAPRKMR